MSQSSLSKWLKIIIIAMALGGLFIYGQVVPFWGIMMILAYPEFSNCHYPWLIMLWLTGIPCYAVLFFSWKIAGNIGKNRAFTYENGKLFKRIAIAAAGDSIFFFVMNVIYLFLNINHPSIVIFSVVIGLVGGAIYVVCSGLSTLVNNAAALQEQSDLTI